MTPAPAGSAEGKLRKVATEELGPVHAAVHAQQRAIAAQELAAKQAHPQAAARARAAAVAATPRVAPAEGQRKVTFSTAGKRRVTFKLTRAGTRLLAHRRRGVMRIRATTRPTSGHTLSALQARRKLR